MKKVKRDILFVAGIACVFIMASLYGKSRLKETQKHQLEEIFPATQFSLEQVNSHKWHLSSSGLRASWYLYTGAGKGYNGPVTVLVQTDIEGNIVQVRITSNHETPSYFQKLEKNNFLETVSRIAVRNYLSGEPVNAVSGATITSRAVLQGVRNGYSKGENINLPEARRPSFGPLEIIVLFLLSTGIMLQWIRNRKVKRIILWSSLVISLVFLGFIYNQPVTVSRIVAVINGYLPEVKHEFYLYLLLGGSVLTLVFTGRNVYCHSVCPFGAAQEILGKTGRAKTFLPAYYRKLKYLQWTITFVAVTAALLLNNPSVAQYEVFGALFQLTASNILFIVLIIVVGLSLFIRRPWCNFMCPVGSVFSYISLIRNTVGKLWRQTVYR
ncbi:MAG: 4Fe-4S binding protein [Bacteroidales bacterium]|nr:4Fe-4S binding protein [Bacteroidales bacterium]MDT8374245.1 4Fe-4S binding protein [Bacteroidales bacterium]